MWDETVNYDILPPFEAGGNNCDEDFAGNVKNLGCKYHMRAEKQTILSLLLLHRQFHQTILRLLKLLPAVLVVAKIFQPPNLFPTGLIF